LDYRFQFYLGIVAILLILYHFLATKRKEETDQVNKLLLYFFFVLILSKILTGWVGGSIEMFFKVLPSIVCFYLITVSCDTDKKLEHLFLLLILLTSFLAWQAHLQVQTGFSLGELKPLMRRSYDLEGNRILRPQAVWWGVFRDPNDLGMAIAIVIPLILNKVIQKKFLYFLPLILTLLGVYATNSRGTILALIVSVGLYFILANKSIKGLGFAGIIGLIIVLFGPSRVVDISSGAASAQSRFDAWHIAFQLFKSHPILGSGADTFTDYHPQTAHNTYLLLLAETGFIGLFLFTAVMAIPMYAATRIIFKEENFRLRASLAAIISAQTGMCFSIIFLSRPYVMLPYLYVALTISYLRVHYPEMLKDIALNIKYKYIIILVFGQIVLFNVMVRLLH